MVIINMTMSMTYQIVGYDKNISIAVDYIFIVCMFTANSAVIRLLRKQSNNS